VSQGQELGLATLAPMMESKKEPMVTCQNYYSYSTAIDKPKKAEKNWGKNKGRTNKLEQQRWIRITCIPG
jgi:hypothetical protein